jgi:histidine triad (HIT) family protein
MVRKEINPQVIWENDSYLAFLDQIPVREGHTLIIPKKHTDYIFDLEDGEYTELMLHAKDVSNKLKKALNPNRIGIVVEGFGVSHVHVHLIPINNIDELHSDSKKLATGGELKEIADKILKNQ